MPLLISLKEPPINMIVEGQIKDEDEKKWDEIFQNGCLMVKNRTGQNIVIPLWKESNVTFIQGVTEEQLEEQKKMAEEAAKGNKVVMPDFAFSSKRSQRGGGGGIPL